MDYPGIYIWLFPAIVSNYTKILVIIASAKSLSCFLCNERVYQGEESALMPNVLISSLILVVFRFMPPSETGSRMIFLP